MATAIIMPKLGFDVEKAKITRWLKGPGDQVNKGDVVAEVETEKVTLEVEAYDSGTLLQVVAPEGTEVPVGQPIAYLGQPGEKVEAAPASAPAPAPPEAKPAPLPPAPPGKRIHASPVAEALAREHGLDLSQVTGTGPGGRITKEDVLAHLEQQPSPAPAPAAEPSPMRRAIARKMTESKPGIPHYYLTVSVDMTGALALRTSINKGLPDAEQISINDLVIKALALTLGEFPEFNAYYLDDRPQPQPSINIGVAIALDQGLIAPALLDCAHKSLRQLSQEAKSLAERTHAGKITPEEFSQATITISNLGMFGIDSFQAIIVPPQVAIVAVGAAHPTAVVNDAGQITVRQHMLVTLSGDHRVTDGAMGARLLARLREWLEHPARLLL